MLYVCRQPMSEVVDPVVDDVWSVDNLKAAIGARFKKMREELGFTQKALCAVMEKPLPSIRDYERGKSIPGGDAIASLVRAGINANWLLTGEGEMLIASSANVFTMHQSMSMPAAEQQAGYVALPLYNDVRAAAGHGAVNGHEQADDALMFKEDWIRYELGAKAQDLCLIRVSGDSMEPTLRAGDVILIDHRACRPDREGIYIMRVGEMLLVKRLQAMPGGKIRVTSDNPAFDPWTLDLEEFGSDVKVVGRVVWSGRRL